MSRAALDAYWTPLALARRCVELVVDPLHPPYTAVEPSVGGGAWVTALRAHCASGVHVRAHDVEPTAPGLALADETVVGDYLTSRIAPAGLVIGNPPYSGDIHSWVDRGLQDAPVVAYLLRSSILGSVGRRPWFEDHPPHSVYVLSPRPRWEGPGALPQTDTADPILVVWTRYPQGSTALYWAGWSR